MPETMKKIATSTLFLAVLLSSCSHYYYVPNVQNVPLFKEKDEFRISAHYGGGDESVTGEIQTAYAITDKIGVAANYMHASGGNVSENDFGKGNYFEGAVGYFKPVSKSGVFEVYGGLGGGGQHHEYQNHYDLSFSGDADLSCFKIYVQPAYGLTFNWLDVAFSTRLSRVSYTNIEYSIYENPNIVNELESLSGKGHFFIEPGITLRGGWKNIKAQVQYVYSGYLNNPKLYTFEEGHISIGLYIAIAKRYK
jgi:hypothetical protein